MTTTLKVPDCIAKLTTAIEDCCLCRKEQLTVELATERGWSQFRIYPNGTLAGVTPDGLDWDTVPDFAQYMSDAAPDLYRELAHLVRLMEPKEREGGCGIPGLATLNGARAALAKARGRGDFIRE